MLLSSLKPPSLPPHLRRFLCSCKTEASPTSPDMARYREAFDRRMSMAGIKPHHRIALGVSGGADSMALCALAAGWKHRNLVGRPADPSGFIDGILAIVVDHRLRPESGEEAKWVGERVSRMGIRCKIVACDWPTGMPKQGHLEEAARDMRYRIFQDTCIDHQTGILLVAHHADDQAELLILRLSRNSGVLGLAGMAFVAQLFPKQLVYGTSSSNHGILLVRPMLKFLKNDMYKICQEECVEWVEDPSNQSSLFARNRIRKSLKYFSNKFKSELQDLISVCRSTRSFVEHSCCRMLETSVTITIHGYAIIDLKMLNPCQIEDLCLSKFLTSVLQFISQRHRQTRGDVSQLLLHYIRNIPCKNALTAAGCYLCPSPGSKGTKVLVCCSPDYFQPVKTVSYQAYSCQEDSSHSEEVHEVIMNAQLCTDLSSVSLDMPFLLAKSSNSILEEAKKLNIISDETCNAIQSLQRVENQHFNRKNDLKHDELSHNSRSHTKLDITVAYGQTCLFMNRFQVRWQLCENNSKDELTSETLDFKRHVCGSCMINSEMKVSVRCMVEADWLHLGKFSTSQSQMQGGCMQVSIATADNLQSGNNSMVSCSDSIHLMAKRALENLKPIPAAARKALPVLVDSQGIVLSIPGIGFQRCACMRVESVFRPLVPLGGGFSSYI